MRNIQLLQVCGKPIGYGRDIPNERNGLVVMQRVGKIAVDVDHGLCILVADPRTIGLAYGTRAHHDQQFGFAHRIVSADRSL
jgi:hypothetical protein